MGHAADGLGGGEFFEHLRFLAGVVCGEEAIDEGGVDAAGGDGVRADVFGDVVGRDGLAHGEDGALAHGVGEAIGESDMGCDGGHVDDGAAASFHVGDRLLKAVEDAFDVDVENALEVIGGADIDISDSGDARVVDEDVDGGVVGFDLREDFGDA